MQFQSVLMVLFGYFRGVKNPSFGNDALQAEDLYLQSAEQLGHLIIMYQRSYGTFGPCGLIYYCNWCASALMDGLSQRPALSRLLHIVLVFSATMCFKMGRGLMRLTVQRAQTFTSGQLLPETIQLLHDFEANVWRPDDSANFSSIWPEFSRATLALHKTRNFEPYRLTELLTKLSIDPGKRESKMAETTFMTELQDPPI